MTKKSPLPANFHSESRGQSCIGPELEICHKTTWTAMRCHMFARPVYHRRLVCMFVVCWRVQSIRAKCRRNSERKQINKFAACQMFDNMNMLWCWTHCCHAVCRRDRESQREGESTVPKIKISLFMKTSAECDANANVHSVWIQFFFNIWYKNTSYLHRFSENKKKLFLFVFDFYMKSCSICVSLISVLVHTTYWISSTRWPVRNVTNT